MNDVLLTATGVLKFIYMAWVEDESLRARQALMNYCQELHDNGYGKAPKEIMAGIDRMDRKTASAWFEETHATFITDDAKMIGRVLDANVKFVEKEGL